MSLSRREFMTAVAGAATTPALCAAASEDVERRADSVIFVWLPGGWPQTDTWDPKRHTPFEPRMRGDQLFGTCPSIPTAVDGVRFGAGLEKIASVMDRGAVVRGLSSTYRFGAVHLKAQHFMLTGHPFPSGFQAPSMGSMVARTLGRRRPDVPAYVYVGRDGIGGNAEDRLVVDMVGAGFLGGEFAPLMVADPWRGLAALSAPPSKELDRRLRLLDRLARSSGDRRLGDAEENHLRSVAAARALMDSPLRAALDVRRGEKPETLAEYEPAIEAGATLEPEYFEGGKFASGLLLARRLVEAGVRFVQVEYPYRAFHSIDMHKHGGRSIGELKRQIDRPLARLILDLEERGLLNRTLVVVASEFGRTVAASAKAGLEPEGFAEESDGSGLTIESTSQYGFHGHMSAANSALLFGGGVRRGFVHGKTADRHPMIAVERASDTGDFRATILGLMGIAPDTHYLADGRPVHVTKDGKCKPIRELYA